MQASGGVVVAVFVAGADAVSGEDSGAESGVMGLAVAALPEAAAGSVAGSSGGLVVVWA